MTRAIFAALSLAFLITLPAAAAVPKQATKQQTPKKQTAKKPAVKRQATKPQVAKQDQQLLKLDLGTRIEQRCDARAADAISQEHKGFQVDRVIAYAFGEAEIHGTEVVAPGAIARSKGKWYRLTYRCQTTSDGLGIVSFEHTLGAEVPGWHQGELAN
jgi:hypothetical protein